MEERGALRKFNHSESSSRPPPLPNAVASSSLSSFQQLVAYVRADAPGRRRRGKKRGKVEFLLFPFPPSLLLPSEGVRVPEFLPASSLPLCFISATFTRGKGSR